MLSKGTLEPTFEVYGNSKHVGSSSSQVPPTGGRPFSTSSGWSSVRTWSTLLPRPVELPLPREEPPRPRERCPLLLPREDRPLLPREGRPLLRREPPLLPREDVHGTSNIGGSMTADVDGRSNVGANVRVGLLQSYQ